VLHALAVDEGRILWTDGRIKECNTRGINIHCVATNVISIFFLFEVISSVLVIIFPRFFWIHRGTFLSCCV
jgi:hypothetical protein